LLEVFDHIRSTSSISKMECKARLAFLLKTLQDNYQQSNATSFVESMKEEYPTAKSDSMDYELVFRGQLDDFISQMSVNEVRR
jgi:hypothetical protein